MVDRIRLAVYVFAILIVWAADRNLAAEERKSVVPVVGAVTTSSSKVFFIRDSGFQLDLLLPRLRQSRIDLPVRSRVTHSHRPLRRIALLNGDRFVAECLDWGSQTAAFQLLSGQIITVPVLAISEMANLPGEVVVRVDSFEADSSPNPEPKPGRVLDETQAASGHSSLRIDSTSPGYSHKFEQPMDFARIEFSFKTAINDASSPSGEWQFDCDDSVDQKKSLVVRIGPDQSISVSGISRDTESASQNLKLSDGWHSFIALIDPKRTRLIVDDAIVASTPAVSIKSICLKPTGVNSTNILWIDDLQILKLSPIDDQDRSPSHSIGRDALTTETGDELFGRIIGITESSVTLETIGHVRSIPLNRVTSLDWSQPTAAIKHASALKAGVVASVEMQSFVDRTECQPERWTVTITRIDSKYLIAQHSLVGELKLLWSDVRRVEPLFVGQSLLVDARRFHLGNSIRTDLHRHLPDGTDICGDFDLPAIPSGQPYFSLDVAELEAASPEAPPASPFLAQLRAGRLVTEVFLNEQRIGNLNQLIRFKARSQTPDRIRVSVPRDLLKLGRNTFRLQQQPLEPDGHEFDDGEIGNLRFEFVQEKQ